MRDLDVILIVFWAIALLVIFLPDLAIWWMGDDRKSFHRDRSIAQKIHGTRNLNYSLALFDAHRNEREHPRTVVPTDRYRQWIAKRDAR